MEDPANSASDLVEQFPALFRTSDGRVENGQQAYAVVMLRASSNTTDGMSHLNYRASYVSETTYLSWKTGEGISLFPATITGYLIGKGWARLPTDEEVEMYNDALEADRQATEAGLAAVAEAKAKVEAAAAAKAADEQAAAEAKAAEAKAAAETAAAEAKAAEEKAASEEKAAAAPKPPAGAPKPKAAAKPPKTKASAPAPAPAEPTGDATK